MKTLLRLVLSLDGPADQDPDVDVVKKVLKALAEDRVILFTQPIVSASHPEQVLYHECLVRILDDDQTIVSPAMFIPSLERLGLMGFLDRYIFGLVVEFLKYDPELILGVNIAAQSANEAARWKSIFSVIGGRRDITDRLLIEITESTRLSKSSGRRFVEQIQLMGCQIAVDDLGDGFSNENVFAIRTPDIIKISGRVLSPIMQSTQHFDRFIECIAHANANAPYVVVEGVENAESLLIVRSAGVRWVQGFHTGKPSQLTKPPRTMTPAVERGMLQFERLVDALIKNSAETNTRSNARLAYAAGLAGEIYGKHSAIAESLHSSLADIMQTKGDRQEETTLVSQCFVALGEIAGRALALPV
ncbi:EAL domain-containing protein [Burkholderia cepacia]|uniref:EAL domain-containing protein n=1 Tax=Burkholderia cepacia TaxID=292 RepID=UPI0018C7FC88|nr:EAL domain-containing protein [Burkholderia cepacia]